MCFYDQVRASAEWIQRKTGYVPEVGVILGSGLGLSLIHI